MEEELSPQTKSLGVRGLLVHSHSPNRRAGLAFMQNISNYRPPYCLLLHTPSSLMEWECWIKESSLPVGAQPELSAPCLLDSASSDDLAVFRGLAQPIL